MLDKAADRIPLCIARTSQCAMRNLTSFLPQLEIPGKHFLSFFSEQNRHELICSVNMETTYIHAWTGAPHYVTGFWSILGCLQKEFACLTVQWKRGRGAHGFSFPLEHGMVESHQTISLHLSSAQYGCKKKKESILGSQNKMEPTYSGRQLREKVTSFQCNFIHNNNNNNWVFSLNNHN